MSKENQRVSLQYSIELSQLPEEVLRLARQSNKILNSPAPGGIDDLLEMQGDEILSLRAIQCIENERQKFLDAGYILDDMVNIINGYISYKVQENVGRAQESSASTEEDSDEEHLPEPRAQTLPVAPPMPKLDPSDFLPDDLAEKLTEFREAVANEKPNQATK
jgi:hypothetical protein